MQTGKKEAKLLEPSEQAGIHTLSEKRKAKLDLMAPLLGQGEAREGGAVTDLTDQVVARTHSHSHTTLTGSLHKSGALSGPVRAMWQGCRWRWMLSPLYE